MEIKKIHLKIIGAATVAIVLSAIIFVTLFPSGPKETWSGNGTGETSIEIPAGANLTQVGRILAEAGVVESASFFAIATYDRSEAKSIQPGRYAMALRMGSDEAIDRLLDPKSRLELRLVIPEGLRLTDSVLRIAKQLSVDSKTVKSEIAKLESGKYSVQLPDYAQGSAEGFLFPATYSFADNVTIEEVLTTMVRRYLQAETATNLKSRVQASGFSMREILTMASLVEAEAFPNDFGKVARTIRNRLDVGMPLQFDATVNYALGTKKLLFTPAEFDFDSPYNTYKYPGLPPGPIGSPGEAAIESVLSPPPGDWLYFVSTNPDKGITKFTASYQEFLKFRAEFQAWYRENR
jgi:UPF0755 protein